MPAKDLAILGACFYKKKTLSMQLANLAIWQIADHGYR